MSSQRPHEPEQLTILISRRPGGGFLLRTPLCPGWCVPARDPAELALAMERAWCEAALAAYARLRGALYDLAETEECVPPEAFPAVATAHPGDSDEVEEARRRRRQRHPATHEPERWVELPDGGMLSPTGRRYGPETRVASAVRARRGGC